MLFLVMHAIPGPRWAGAAPVAPAPLTCFGRAVGTTGFDKKDWGYVAPMIDEALGVDAASLWHLVEALTGAEGEEVWVKVY